ncbi:uncharacterized protein comm3 isoform X1 [Drosophila takahashii]|uniref:uncharacterized protein comm3 isoform X1 n=1 Tax=Drosophila takahashii TaxID=29030 RepID=UPI001CF8A3E9|nr:uncharacterized protein LOC108058700 isoform X1 [Drosophila takahashii]XP_044249722.1 uncharacterized protein LOC108058700 isoform X1 [Drosophila takahashii]XP_044249723.1 uncharacterized protein LOC108058700 isoform X1 [Drosophila takahashii]XP_044249724.1 uncharacterized protein LOC108058700 isoform X1 [Drosophila takahashii]XP_044249725.1 uncharacterized protein LOC108058700 isoform X1 [Drosophila takahashii]XP_044249726.1 uncharacterized protein LOC108058700 isoform X1 [Drosophila takah
MADLLKALNITGNLLAGLEDTGNLTIATATSTTLSEGLNGTATTLDATSTNSGEKLDLGGFDLPGNYSILINKLEQLALGLDSALGNFTIDRQEVEINLSGAASANEVADVADDLFDVLPAARAPPPHIAHGSRIYTGDDGQDFAHVVSDIWIGVILTLLIVFVIFFICACFVYHKFQQWKNSYRANHSDPTIEICRRCPPDYEAESLPSYTIVSGLPTYDDALEEFRKAGIILTPAVVPIIKIFECENGKEQAVGYSLVETNISGADGGAGADNVSIASTTCNCGNSSPTSSLPSYSAATAAAMAVAAAAPPQVIELSPEHLASLSQKRLSLQISFNNSVRRQSPLRNHLLRSRAVGNTAGMGPSEGAVGVAIHGSGGHGGHGHGAGATILPALHRSTSTISLSNERQLLDQRLRHLHHRGSLY